MGQGPFLRKYGVETTIDFQLYETDGIDLKTDAVHASGDTKVMKDEGAEANTSNGFTDEGQGYSIVLTATEMQAARVVVYVVDQTSPKVWLDTVIVVETYGNASAMHAFDLDTATQDVNVAQISGDSTAADNLEAACDGNGYDIGGIDVSELNTAVDAIGSDGSGLTEAGGDGDHLTEAGGDGDHLTAVPWNAAWDTEVQSECTDALNAYDPPTDTEMDNAFAALNNLSAADVNAEVDQAIEDYHLDHLLAVTYDPASKPGAADALLNELVENDGGVSRYTANALEEAPGGGGVTPDVNVTQIYGIQDAAINLSNAFQLGAIQGNVDDLSPSASQFDVDITAHNYGDNDAYIGRVILFVEGGNVNYCSVISDYATGTPQTITVSPAFPGAPANEDAFLILPYIGVLPAEVADAVWDEATSGHTGAGSACKALTDVLADTGTDGVVLANDAITAAKIAASAIGASEIATGAIDADAIASDLNTYQAKVWLIDDDGAGTPTDRYVVVWFLNSQPVTSGITSPTIQVIEASDGSDLVGSTPMTQIASTGLYRYDETSNRIADGAHYIVKVEATIGGSTRTWYQPIGRDSA